MSSTLCWLAAMGLACRAAPPSPHPLTPLTAAEIRAAVAIFKGSGRLHGTYRFNFIALDEPPKASVLRDAASPRRAFAVVYDRDANRTYEAIADLTSGQLASWKEIPGAQPPVGENDSTIADRIVRADPRWREALRVRGIRDPNSVLTVAWPAGYFGLPGDDEGRIVRVAPYYSGGAQNYLRASGGRRGGAREPDHRQDRRLPGYRPRRAGFARELRS